VSNTGIGFQSFPDIDFLRRPSVGVRGVLPDVVNGGTGIASFSDAAGSAVPVLDLARKYRQRPRSCAIAEQIRHTRRAVRFCYLRSLARYAASGSDESLNTALTLNMM
jgi:hypothetical protein